MSLCGREMWGWDRTIVCVSSLVHSTLKIAVLEYSGRGEGPKIEAGRLEELEKSEKAPWPCLPPSV